MPDFRVPNRTQKEETMPRSSLLSKALYATLGLALGAFAAPARSQDFLVTTRYFTIAFPVNWKTTTQTNPPDSTYATVSYSNGNDRYGAQLFSKLHGREIPDSELGDSVVIKAIRDGFNVDEMKECAIGSYKGTCGQLRHTVDPIGMSIAFLMVGKLEFRAEILIFPNMPLAPQTDFKNALGTFKLIGPTRLIAPTGKANTAAPGAVHDALGRVQRPSATKHISVRASLRR